MYMDVNGDLSKRDLAPNTINSVLVINFEMVHMCPVLYFVEGGFQ